MRETRGSAIKKKDRTEMEEATSTALSKFRVAPRTWRGWMGNRRKERNARGAGKVGGKDEINSRVYGALKVAGISLTTWQTATVVVLLAGGLKCIDGRSLARECARGPVRECEFGLSFIRSRASRESSVNDSPVELLRNFTAARTVREVRAEKCARGKKR